MSTSQSFLKSFSSQAAVTLVFMAMSNAPLSTFAMSRALPQQDDASTSSQTAPQGSSQTSSAVAHSGTYRAILFGGSCDEGAPSNSFLPSFTRLAPRLIQSGWDVRSLYEGDIARCSIPATDSACQGSQPAQECCPAYVNIQGWSVATLATAVGKSPSDIGRASVRELLNSLDQAAQDLKSGDQLLLAINTHGYGYPQPGQTETKHYICVSPDEPYGRVSWADPTNGASVSAKSGLFAIDDSRLQSRLQKLKDAGVKLAFLDDSCFSGGSVPSFQQYGCVMSATGSQQENVSTIPSGTAVINNKQVTVASGTDTSYNLGDLLGLPTAQLSQLSLGHAGRLTMEELWLKMLSHSRISSDTPEFSGFLDEQKSIDDLNLWLNTLGHDVGYRGQNSPLSSCTNCSKESSQPAQDYATQFLAPYLDPSKAQSYQSIVQNYWPAPGYPDQFDGVQVVSASAINSKLSSLGSQWSALGSQYSALVAQESSALNELKTVGMHIQLNFSGALAGTQDLFNTIVAQVNGTSVFFYPVSSNNSGDNSGDHNGSPGLLEVMDTLSSPDDANFVSETQIAADAIGYKMNAYKLQHNSYTSGLSDSYSDALAAMIGTAETTAWNGLSQEAKNLVKKDFKIIAALRQQERSLLSELPMNVKVDLVEARMYSYLSFRDRAGPANVNLNNCSDFTLKNY